MAQKVTGYVTLQIPAGKATPAPPVGPALGQHGVNIAGFTKGLNERPKTDVGLIITEVIDGDAVSRTERCMSLPGIAEEVKRVEHIRLL